MAEAEPDAAIVAFLRARLDEDESLITRNSYGNGLADGFPDYRTCDDADTEAADEYIRHFGPERMTLEVETKRSILRDAADVPTISMRRVVRRLAASYAAHPDYDSSWRLSDG